MASKSVILISLLWLPQTLFAQNSTTNLDEGSIFFSYQKMVVENPWKYDVLPSLLLTKKWDELSEEEKKRVQEARDHYKKLPPEKKEQLRKKWEKVPPEEKKKYKLDKKYR